MVDVSKAASGFYIANLERYWRRLSQGASDNAFEIYHIKLTIDAGGSYALR